MTETRYLIRSSATGERRALFRSFYAAEMEARRWISEGTASRIEIIKAADGSETVMAEVCSDALGRTWTDLTTTSAMLF